VTVPGLGLRIHDLLVQRSNGITVGLEVQSTPYQTYKLDATQVNRDAALLLAGGLTPAGYSFRITEVQYVTTCFGCISLLSPWTYTYDTLDRLTLADNTGNNTLDPSFQYDDVGTMTYNSAVGSYVYPLASSPRPHAPITAGSKTFTYDANGNTSSFISDGGNPDTFRATNDSHFDSQGNFNATITGSGVGASGQPITGQVTITSGVVSGPTVAGPSAEDFDALRILGQSQSTVLHGGIVTKIRPY
jgi:hypothetical protein